MKAESAFSMKSFHMGVCWYSARKSDGTRQVTRLRLMEAKHQSSRMGGVGVVMRMFEYQPTRNGDHAKRFLGDYDGVLVTDGYAGYNKLTNVTHACCWAHVRRKFAEALPEDSEAAKTSMAAKGLEYIDGLFAAERDLSDVEMIAKIRKETSKKIVDDFYDFLGSFTANGAALQKAVGYAVSLKKRLTAFLEDPMIPLSNNRAENAIRPFVVGRKNWLFSDTVRGAESSAVIYSLIETAKANSQNPETYLIELMKK